MERPKLTDNPLFRFLTVVLLPAVLLIILRTAGGSYYESVLILFFINVILAASLNLTNGITGIFSLGHAAFMALGAYISSILTLSEKMKQTMVSNMPEWLAKIQLPFVPAVLTAAVITMLIAGLYEEVSKKFFASVTDAPLQAGPLKKMPATDASGAGSAPGGQISDFSIPIFEDDFTNPQVFAERWSFRGHAQKDIEVKDGAVRIPGGGTGDGIQWRGELPDEFAAEAEIVCYPKWSKIKDPKDGDYHWAVMTGDYGTFGVRSDGYGVSLYQPVADQPTRSCYPWIANFREQEPVTVRFERRRIGGTMMEYIYYINGVKMNAYTAPIPKKKFGIPVNIWTFDLWPDAVWSYGVPRLKVSEAMLEKMIRRIYGGCDRIFVSSKRFSETIGRYSDKECIYAPNWLRPSENVTSELRLPKDKVNFTFTGNISRYQNLINTIEGFVRAELDNAQLNIVGDGSYIQEVKACADRFDRNNIVFHGRRPYNEMHDILQQSQVLVMPLMPQEGIEKTEPLKLQSYLQAGKPVFGVLNGAGRDIIENNGLGLCAEPSDPEAIAEGFRDMIPFADKHSAEVALAAQRLMQTRFNKEAIVQRITDNLITA